MPTAACGLSRRAGTGSNSLSDLLRTSTRSRRQLARRADGTFFEGCYREFFEHLTKYRLEATIEGFLACGVRLDPTSETWLREASQRELVARLWPTTVYS